MPGLSWSSESVDDLCEITAYLLDKAPEAAERVINAIDEAVQQLRRDPYFGHFVPEFDRKEIRELVVYRYRVIYEYREDHCRVLRIFHTSRDLPQHFQVED